LQARAAAHQRLEELGSAVGALGERVGGGNEGDGGQGNRTRITLNGAELELAPKRSEHSPARALDATEQRCRAREALLLLSDKHAIGTLRTTIRLDGADQTMVACLDPKGAIDVHELLDRTRRAAESADPTAFGALDVTWALREGSGSRVVSVRSLSALPLARMFPETGDAPGGDLADVPRPNQSQRVLSTGADSRAAPSLVAYTVQGDPSTTLSRYASELRSAGFEVDPLETGDSAGSAPEPSLLAARGDVLALVRAASESASQSVVVIVPLSLKHATFASRGR
jgi:hypothetical protein